MTARMYKGINTTLDEGQTPVLAYRVAGDGAAYASEEVTAPLLTGTDPSANLVLAYVKGTNPHSKDECPTFRETETSACLTPWDERHNPPKQLVVEGPAFSTKLHNTKSNQAGKLYEEYTPGLQASSPPPALLTSLQVRRLLPVECERLQGFPDFWTDVPGASDTARYKALGNSWPVPMIRWVGSRIAGALR